MTNSTTTPTQDLRDRDLRQRELVPPQRLAECRALVIGVGAIGRQVAVQLAAVGMGQIDLADFDQVAVENLAAQGYWPKDLGRAKVHATADLCRMINPDAHVHAHADVFRRSSVKALALFHDRQHQLAVFCCVDSITARRLLWEAVRERAGVFLDGRMSAEVIRVLAVGEPAHDGYYESTLFEQGRAYAGACTARSTIYAASIAAGLMVGQFTKWLRRLPIERDVGLNLLSAELSVT
ncbi:MAG: ThiF family adenylyltransferase [Tepidisphaeraceae bacterium]